MRVVLLNMVWPVILSAVGPLYYGYMASMPPRSGPISIVGKGLARHLRWQLSSEVSPGSARAGRHPRSMGATYKERCARDARGN